MGLHCSKTCPSFLLRIRSTRSAATNLLHLSVFHHHYCTFYVVIAPYQNVINSSHCGSLILVVPNLLPSPASTSLVVDHGIQHLT